MMEYKILESKYIYALKMDIDEHAKLGWRLVNCWSAASLSYEKHYAAMEKSL